jgi:hypothetical protein
VAGLTALFDVTAPRATALSDRRLERMSLVSSTSGGSDPTIVTDPMDPFNNSSNRSSGRSSLRASHRDASHIVRLSTVRSSDGPDISIGADISIHSVPRPTLHSRSSRAESNGQRISPRERDSDAVGETADAETAGAETTGAETAGTETAGAGDGERR